MQFCSNIDIFLNEGTVTELLPKVEDWEMFLTIKKVALAEVRCIYICIYVCICSFVCIYICIYVCICFVNVSAFRV